MNPSTKSYTKTKPVIPEEVIERSLYGPRPEPVIIRSGEAGDPNDPTSFFPITWEREPSPLDIDTILEKSIFPNGNLKLRNISSFLTSLKIPFLLDELSEFKNGNSIGFRMWLLAYAKNNNLSDESGWKYLSMISRDLVNYPKPIQMALTNYIKHYRKLTHSSGYPNLEGYVNKYTENKEITDNVSDEPDHYANLIDSSKTLGMYLPKNLSLLELDYLFLTGVYWLRKFRPEANKLSNRLSNINLIDLYLVTSNPFDRYPAQKLLSYYSDLDLYNKFGRVGNFYYPKSYLTKAEQLNGLVALSRYRFGYFHVENWTSPIKLTFYSQSNRSSMTLDELVNKLDDRSNNLLFRYPGPLDHYSLMPILQLALMIYSSGTMIDIEPWKKFLEMVDSRANILKQEYSTARRNPFQLETNKLGQNVENIFIYSGKSVEQPFYICILCMHDRDLGDFGHCGHGVCMSCQIFLRNIKCPFCSEHFVCDNLSNDFVEQVSEKEPVPEQLQLRIYEIQKLSPLRSFKFDWANLNVKTFS